MNPGVRTLGRGGMQSGITIRHKPSAIPKMAFTLIELLTVIVIIGILVSLIMAAVVEMKNRARKKHEEAMIAALYSAIRAYHTEYSRWPCPDPAVGGTWTNNDNGVVIEYLLSDRTESTYNPRQRIFWETRGTVTNPYTRRPFSIVIDTAANSVKIDSKTFQ